MPGGLRSIPKARTLWFPIKPSTPCSGSMSRRRLIDERSECKPDAKRKRDSAQPQERAQPSRNVTYTASQSQVLGRNRVCCVGNRGRLGGYPHSLQAFPNHLGKRLRKSD